METPELEKEYTPSAPLPPVAVTAGTLESLLLKLPTLSPGQVLCTSTIICSGIGRSARRTASSSLMRALARSNSAILATSSSNVVSLCVVYTFPSFPGLLPGVAVSWHPRRRTIIGSVLCQVHEAHRSNMRFARTICEAFLGGDIDRIN